MPNGYFRNDADEARELALGVVSYYRSRRALDALSAAANAVGISKWSLWAIYHKRRKSVGYGVVAALRREYLAICERQVRQLEAQMARLKQESGDDDDLVDLSTAVDRVVEKVRAARERSG